MQYPYIGIMGQGRAEVMKYFRDFMEDYNTATMPHEKYYHYDKWEMADYQRRKLTESRGGGSIGEGKYDAFDDERNRTAELKRKKEEDSRKEVLFLSMKILIRDELFSHQISIIL